MPALSLAIRFSVASEPVTVLGTFLLPPPSYLGLRLPRVPFPGTQWVKSPRDRCVETLRKEPRG